MKKFIQKNNWWLYFILTFLISWLIWIAGTNILPKKLNMIPLIIGAFGPFLAAIIILRISQSKAILLELPHEIFIDIEPLLVELSHMGIQAIMSHPERHPVIAKRPELLLKWLDRSVHLQVTCGSLLGDFGSRPQAAAWHFLCMGWTSFVATDSHDVGGRRPRMKAAYEQIAARLGSAMARLVCIENPLRVFQGRDVFFARDVNARTWIDDQMRSR